ncbi:MAG: ankyrin repeat domain-containing protein, partial [Elusimicrobia bacterium]|nr:ankyrin repeat domain-containing protein [Elusimicrobiota bacterium]
MRRSYSTLPALLLLAAACSSPLTRAAKLGRTEEILALLPSERGHCGEALNEAAANDHEETLKALLDGGCGVNSKDSDGYTALMAAAARGYDGCVRLLLERKADVDLRSWNDKTAVMLARRARHEDTVKLLESLDGLPLPPAVKTAAPGRAAEPAPSRDIPAPPAPERRAHESLRG